MGRLWTIAVLAQAFHQLPSVVARDLDEDPEQLSLLCLPLLNYAEMKRVFDKAKDDKELEPYKDSKVMDLVRKTTFELHKERVARRKAAQAGAAEEPRA